MEVRNLQNMILECIAYADEINKNGDVYPEDARMPLRDLLRHDIIVFLGYLYEPGNKHTADQMEFIRTNLRMNLSEEKFAEFVQQKCS